MLKKLIMLELNNQRDNSLHIVEMPLKIRYKDIFISKAFYIRFRNMNIIVDVEDEDYDDAEMNTRRKNVIHPFRIFTALQVYKSDSVRMTCIPNQSIVRALENSFYQAFRYLLPTNKRCLIAVDVSDSMSSPVIGMG